MLWAGLAGIFLAQSAPTIAPDTTLPPPPPALAAALDSQGYPDPDNIEWMRGAFADASDTQKAERANIQHWITNCSRLGTAEVRANLAAMGVSLRQKPEAFPLPACRGVIAFMPPQSLRTDWPDFHRAYSAARNDWSIFRYGAKLGFEAVPFDPDWTSEEARKLLHAVVREQVYRGALGWGHNGPATNPATLAALQMFSSLNIAREDAKNLVMMKRLVAKKGWPGIAAVGKTASNAAWLLAQHADRDPAFQLRVLRLMRPMAETGDVRKDNYAYLYDRVMLKLTGRQRYGTQATCADGKHVPLPLEAGIDVDAERAKMGMPPIAEYIADLNGMFGPCPSAKAD
ncbi:DUF6624 domain-containing protein [Stakelama marina]|uniref:Uncharacterized protein n=1 Tax=Stakelama marina TaxID=2826939 RepID=A0A8T4IIC4_9SPHN|nr:DUF6624 domain-containing protein [Stakelama marina]MBR0553634.1 hypothetical protein [Stakelama marina]